MSSRPSALPWLVALAVAVAAAPTAAQKLFDVPIYVPGSGGGEFRATGDFDGDGDTDLLHMTGWLDWSGMTVFFNDGAGRFTPAPEHEFGAGPQVEVAQFDPALGDFNGDGLLDVAVDHDSFTGGVSGLEVLFGDGIGGFTSVFMPYGRGPRDLFAGQTDGDAAHELFVYELHADFTRSFAWLDWNGVEFVSSTPLPVGLSSGDPDGAFVLTWGDHDGDGDTDTAATSVDYQKVRLFPTVDGAPTYGPSWPVGPNMANVNHRVRFGDLDGDGDDDLLHIKSLITTDPGPLLQVYENRGGGLLVQKPVFTVEPLAGGAFGPHSVKLGDWDGDGWLDLVTVASDLKLVRSNGDWTWSDGGVIENTAGQHAGGGLADVDADGQLDYVATHTLALGDGSFPGPPAPDVFGLSIGGLPDMPTFLDHDGEGDLDLVGSGNLWRNDGTGGFTALGGLFAPLFEALPAPLLQGRTVARGDLDGDGLPDYVVTIQRPGAIIGSLVFVEMRTAVDDGFGSYEWLPGTATPAGVQIPAPLPDPGYWDMADADGDGDLDILGNNGYWRQSTPGVFDGFVTAWSGRGRGTFDLGGDGDMDVIVTRDLGTTAQIVLYRNNGGGVYQEFALATQADDEVTPRLVDLDRDGDLDLWSGHPDLDGVLVWEHSGNLLIPSPTLPIRGVQLHAPAFEDVDDDGIDELLLARTETDTFASPHWIAAAWERVGPGLVFEPGDEHMLIQEVESFLDVDGDGDHDVYGHRRYENIRVPAPEGGGVRQFGTGFPGTGGITPQVGVAGPIVSSGDSELRIVWGRGGAAAFILYGPTETALPGIPFPGMTLYVDTPAVSPPLLLGGAPGAPGAGELSFLMPTHPLFFGVVFVVQVFVEDPGSTTGYSATQGTEITFGI